MPLPTPHARIVIACALISVASGGLAWASPRADGGTALSTPAAPDDSQVAIGRALFKRIWVPAPSSTKANDGLGPLFNGRSCAQCHGADSAGRVVTDDAGRLLERGAVVRLSNAKGGGDPVYGSQIQTRGVPGVEPEAAVSIEWATKAETFEDGSEIVLRRPVVRLDQLSSGPLAQDTQATLMLAPSLKAAARIAAVEAAAVATVASRSAAVPAVEDARRVFGRKATATTLDDMTSLAFSRDLGLSTSRYLNSAGDCTAAQESCVRALHGAEAGEAEIDPAIVAAIARYLASLDTHKAEPLPDTAGAALFASTGCASCHTPTLPGRSGVPVALYSDLGLHPMGADLAGLTETDRARDVWRTAPLIGLSERLKAGATLLHDGRARTVAEAVLWHGGAADAARVHYKALGKADRDALEQYVLSRE